MNIQPSKVRKVKIITILHFNSRRIIHFSFFIPFLDQSSLCQVCSRVSASMPHPVAFACELIKRHLLGNFYELFVTHNRPPKKPPSGHLRRSQGRRRPVQVDCSN